MKSILVPPPAVHVAHFDIHDTQIIAYCIVNKKNVDLQFTHGEFELWADNNNEDLNWPEIYGGYSEMQRLLTDYITHVYSLENEMV